MDMLKKRWFIYIRNFPPSVLQGSGSCGVISRQIRDGPLGLFLYPSVYFELLFTEIGLKPAIFSPLKKN
jgi:hypothetical protein